MREGGSVVRSTGCGRVPRKCTAFENRSTKAPRSARLVWGEFALRVARTDQKTPKRQAMSCLLLPPRRGARRGAHADAHTPSLPEDRRSAALASAEGRYRQFVEQVVQEFAGGRRFIDDLPQEPVAYDTELGANLMKVDTD